MSVCEVQNRILASADLCYCYLSQDDKGKCTYILTHLKKYQQIYNQNKLIKCVRDNKIFPCLLYMLLSTLYLHHNTLTHCQISLVMPLIYSKFVSPKLRNCFTLEECHAACVAFLFIFEKGLTEKLFLFYFWQKTINHQGAAVPFVPTTETRQSTWKIYSLIV